MPQSMTAHIITPPAAVFPENQVLLDTLTQISTLFTQESVRFRLRGGWALDFLLGRETRAHGGLDLVI